MQRTRQILSGGWLGNALSNFTRGLWPATQPETPDTVTRPLSLPARAFTLTLRDRSTDLTLPERSLNLTLRDE